MSGPGAFGHKLWTIGLTKFYIKLFILPHHIKRTFAPMAQFQSADIDASCPAFHALRCMPCASCLPPLATRLMHCATCPVLHALRLTSFATRPAAFATRHMHCCTRPVLHALCSRRDVVPVSGGNPPSFVKLAWALAHWEVRDSGLSPHSSGLKTQGSELGAQI